MNKILIEMEMESRTRPGDYHKVLIKENKAECDCVGNGFYKKECQHIQTAKELYSTLREVASRLSIRKIKIDI